MKQTIQDLLDILQDPIITLDPDPAKCGVYAIRVHREGKPDLAFMYCSNNTLAHWAKQLEDLGNGTHSDPRLQDAYDRGEGTIVFESLREAWHRRVRFNPKVGKAVRIHFSDERGIVEYRSIVEASMDLRGVSKLLMGDDDLPEGVECIEYMDSEYMDSALKDLYRAMRWGQWR